MTAAGRKDGGRAAERRGRWAETAAAWLLRLKGYRIVARRVKPPRGSSAGEIDIVARRGGVLAFVEIKARPSRDDGLWAISPRQRQRILRAAAWFVKIRPEYAADRMRFDAIVVAPGRLPHHLEDAWRDESPL